MPAASPEHRSDDVVLLDVREHWWCMVPAVSLLVVSIAAGMAAAVVAEPVASMAALVAILVSLSVAGWRYVRWVSARLVLTTDRVVRRSGLFVRRRTAVPLERVDAVDVRQGLLGRLIGAGDLVVDQGPDAEPLVLHRVARPLEVADRILDEIARRR